MIRAGWWAPVARIATASLLALAGCGGSVSGSLDSPGTGMQPLALLPGSVSVEMNLPPGSVISSASYTLTGPNSFSRSTSVDFPSTGSIAFDIDDVPPADIYNLDLTVTSPDGTNVCTSSGQFGVAESMATILVLVPHCSNPPAPVPQVGTLELSVDFPASVPITTLSFSIEGPGGASMPQSWGVAGDGGGGTVTFVLMNVPVESGEMVSLQAMSSDGTEACSATSQLSIVADSTTKDHVVLLCMSVEGAAAH
jgi:hypothetical protein